MVLANTVGPRQSLHIVEIPESFVSWRLATFQATDNRCELFLGNFELSVGVGVSLTSSIIFITRGHHNLTHLLDEDSLVGLQASKSRKHDHSDPLNHFDQVKLLVNHDLSLLEQPLLLGLEHFVYTDTEQGLTLDLFCRYCLL